MINFFAKVWTNKNFVLSEQSNKDCLSIMITLCYYIEAIYRITRTYKYWRKSGKNNTKQ